MFGVAAPAHVKQWDTSDDHGAVAMPVSENSQAPSCELSSRPLLKIESTSQCNGGYGKDLDGARWGLVHLALILHCHVVPTGLTPVVT